MQSTEQEAAEDALIAEELRLLAQPDRSAPRWSEMVAAPSMWSHHYSSQQENLHSDPNKHRFNHYADKQLFHLVLAEEFDFARIAAILSKQPSTQTTSSATSAPGSPRRPAASVGASSTCSGTTRKRRG